MKGQDILFSPPRTIMEVFRMLPEGTLAEVIGNTLYMSPTPLKNHQRVLRKLLIQLDLFVTEYNLGEVFCAPFDVYLDEHANAVQPDLLFISKVNSRIIDNYETVHGVPDLIIEILSSGNKKHDTVTKFQLYEKFGVKEYWIVDPDTRLSTGYSYHEGKFIELAATEGRLMSKLLGRDFYF